MDDRNLLDRYVRHSDEEAFQEFVRRHLNFVYSVALRQVGGDTQFAQDVAQIVFTDLAGKAGALAGHPMIAGWLFTSTRFAAAKLVRCEQLRRAREEKAHAMQQILEQNQGEAARWEEIRPVLDETLAELKSGDRDAVLLRFFESRGYAEVGAKLSISEDAARVRVDRALEKLRARLARRGLTSTSAALAAVLGNHAVMAAPSGLSATIASSALANALAPGALAAIFMSMTKLQMGIASLIMAAGVGGIALQARATATLQAELAGIQAGNRDLSALRTENDRLAGRVAERDELRGDDAALEQVGGAIQELKGRLTALAQTPEKKTGNETVGTLDGAPVYDISKAEVKPRQTVPLKPVYPEALRVSNTAGNVTLDFIIDAKGNVRNATVVSATHEEFEEAALAAIALVKYAPAAKEGQPVNVHVQMGIRFTLDKNEKKQGSH